MRKVRMGNTRESCNAKAQVWPCLEYLAKNKHLVVPQKWHALLQDLRLWKLNPQA